MRGNSARRRLPFAAGAGEPPLHPRRPVRRAPTRCSARAASPTRIRATCPSRYNRPLDFFYSELAQSNRNSLIVNYSWDIPGRHDGRLARCCSTAGRSRARTTSSRGDWATVTFTTSDNFDFTGGEAGNGACLAGSEPCLHIVRPVLVGDPLAGSGDPLTGFFNTAAFARPARGTYGNAPRNVVKKPGSSTRTSRCSRTSTFGGSRARAVPRRDLQSVQPRSSSRTSIARRGSTPAARRSTRTSAPRSASATRRARRASSSCRCG